MATDIEWTRGDDGSKGETWNPTVGCSRVSPGCDNCYAIGVAHRAMQPAHRGLTVAGRDGPTRGGLTTFDRRPDWTGEVRLLPERLDTPLRWRKPRRVFVDSMSDLFHPDVPHAFIVEVFARMAIAGDHTYQVLTKRPQRMAQILGNEYFERDFFMRRHSRAVQDDVQRLWARGSKGSAMQWPLPNVWAGTSVENQRYADLRIPHLLATPAAVRFLSIEPLLGPVDLTDWLDHGYCREEGAERGIDWVIVGGESGPGARPMHPQWVRDLRDQCVVAGVPFFFKQWGEWVPEATAVGRGELRGVPHDGGADRARVTPDAFMRRVGKKSAGRELDGRTWDEMPA